MHRSLDRHRACRGFGRHSPRSHASARSPVELGKETSIPFVGTIGLDDFEADGDRGVWLQDQRRNWYYATHGRARAPGCPSRNGSRVDTRFGGNSLDRTGALLVDGQRCHIDSLVTERGPAEEGEEAEEGLTPRRARARARAMHGWIILDKPLGLGSTQGVSAVKRALRAGRLWQGQGRAWRHARSAGDRRAADRDRRGDQARRADARQRQGV